MNRSELPNELVDRGIYWQFGGFTLVALGSTAVLAEFAGSDSRAFLYFEIAVTKLYWAFVIPLAGLFDGVAKCLRKCRSSGRNASKGGLMKVAVWSANKCVKKWPNSVLPCHRRP